MSSKEDERKDGKGSLYSRAAVKRGQTKKHTLPRTERLRLNTEIQRVFARGSRRKQGKIVFISLASLERKAGFIASRNIGCAAKRNRVRRILREAYRMNKEYFEGLNVILYTEDVVSLDEAMDSIAKYKEGR